MGTLTYQFVTTNDFVDFLIRYGTRWDYSHVDCVLPDGTLLGAQWDGVKIRQPNYKPFTKVLQVSFETPYADDIRALLKTQIGKPYDFKSVFGFTIGNRDWRNPDAWFCSELQTWAAEQCGFFNQHPLDLPVDRISPRDQYLLFSPFLELSPQA
jgi:hypothetical protein